MIRGIVAAALGAAVLTPSAHAATGWTPAFPVGLFSVAKAVMGTDGTVVITGLFYDGATNHPAVQVRPPGGALGSPQIITQSGSTPAVAPRPDGSFFGAWTDNGAVVTGILPAGGSTFTDLKTQPVSATGSPFGSVVVAVDGQGNGWSLWVSTQGGAGASTGSLSLGERPASGAAPTSQLVEANGLQANTDTTVQGPQLSAGGDGHPILGWRTNTTNNNTSQTFTYDRLALRPAGGALGAPITVDQTLPGDGVTTGIPQVAVNATGAALAVWDRQQTGVTTLHARVGTTTALGGDQNPVVSGGTNPHTPRAAVATDGTMIASWLATVGANRIQVGRYTGVSWGAAQTITPAGATAPGSYDFAASPSGALLVGTISGSGPCGAEAAYAPAGAGFGTSTPVGSAFDSFCGVPTVALGSTGDGVMTTNGSRSGNPNVHEAAGFDASPPVLRSLSIPGTATTGTAAAFSVQPVDIWNSVTTFWSFGDGATANGTAVSHAYDMASTWTVSVTATDTLGNATSTTGQVSVTAPASGGGGGGGTGDTGNSDQVAPVITAFTATHRTFAVAKAATALTASVKRRPPRGTTFFYSLSEPGAAALAIRRELPGRRLASKRCVKPTKANAKRKHCTRLKLMGTLKRSGVAGANAVKFSGRLGRFALAPGRYRVTLTVVDAAGNRSKRPTLRFRIVR